MYWYFHIITLTDTFSIIIFAPGQFYITDLELLSTVPSTEFQRTPFPCSRKQTCSLFFGPKAPGAQAMVPLGPTGLWFIELFILFDKVAWDVFRSVRWCLGGWRKSFIKLFRFIFNSKCHLFKMICDQILGYWIGCCIAMLFKCGRTGPIEFAYCSLCFRVCVRKHQVGKHTDRWHKVGKRKVKLSTIMCLLMEGKLNLNWTQIELPDCYHLFLAMRLYEEARCRGSAIATVALAQAYLQQCDIHRGPSQMRPKTSEYSNGLSAKWWMGANTSPTGTIHTPCSGCYISGCFGIIWITFVDCNCSPGPHNQLCPLLVWTATTPQHQGNVQISTTINNNNPQQAYTKQHDLTWDVWFKCEDNKP